MCTSSTISAQQECKNTQDGGIGEEHCVLDVKTPAGILNFEVTSYTAYSKYSSQTHETVSVKHSISVYLFTDYKPSDLWLGHLYPLPFPF